MTIYRTSAHNNKVFDIAENTKLRHTNTYVSNNSVKISLSHIELAFNLKLDVFASPMDASVKKILSQLGGLFSI